MRRESSIVNRESSIATVLKSLKSDGIFTIFETFRKMQKLGTIHDLPAGSLPTRPASPARSLGERGQEPWRRRVDDPRSSGFRIAQVPWYLLNAVETCRKNKKFGDYSRLPTDDSRYSSGVFPLVSLDRKSVV